MSQHHLPPGLLLRRRLTGNTLGITRIAWSPSGHILASPSGDRTIKLWDTITGQILHTLSDHTDRINDAAWSPDGTVIASASDDATIKLWDTCTGKCLKTLKGHTAALMRVTFASDGQTLASGSDDGTVKLWEMRSGQNLNTLTSMLTGQQTSVTSVAYSPEGNFLVVDYDNGFVQLWNASTSRFWFIGGMALTSIAWSPDGQHLAAGSEDGMIRLWKVSDEDQQSEGPIVLESQLEGHTDWITSLSFSSDGRLLASKSWDGTVRLWRTDTWETVYIIHEPASGKVLPGIAFHPTEPVLATLGEEDTEIRVWDLDIPTLLAETQGLSSMYRNAKVVLVGDSGVGKSGLGLVLTGQSYQATESTHARHVWTFENRSVALGGGREEIQEIFLWDLAGQPGYRLIHQLHLNEVMLALVVMDAHSETDPFAGVYHWVRALWVAQRPQGQSEAIAKLKKFLVSARIDRGGIAVSRDRIDRLGRELHLNGFFETSAKEGWGIMKLAEAIREAIDWEALPKVSSTALFQEIKAFLVTEKEVGHVLASRDDLYQKFLSQRKKEDVWAQFETCIEQMETQGLLRKLSVGNLILLQPERIDAYASALVNAVKDEPDGFGSIQEEKVRAGAFYIPASERLPDKEQERLLLIAMIEDLLRNEIALRQRTEDGTYLVFPSQSTRENDELPEPEQKAVTFRFEGPVLNIYATLAVRLSHSGLFERKDLWRNGITYRSETGDMCGLLLRNSSEGRAELTLFFDPLADTRTGESKAVQLHFEDYVYEHLRRHALAGSIQRQRQFACPACGERFTNEQVLRRRQRNFDMMTCYICDTSFSIAEKDEEPDATSLVAVSAMDRSADTKREHEVAVSLYDTTRLRNPYYEVSGVRNPVLFMGRVDILRRLFSAIAPMQSISLLGTRRIGKSALIQHMYRPKIQQQSAVGNDLRHHLFVLIDLGEFLYKTSEDFFRSVSEHVIAQLRKKLEPSPMQPELPDYERGDDLFEAVLDEARDLGFHTVLLLDGFDNILRNRSFDLEFLRVLRALAGKVSYVITSVAPLQEICHQAIADSPFFNIFGAPYRLEPLTQAEAEQLVQEPSRQANHPFTAVETAWVLSLAGRHPFFIQRVCYFLFEEKLARDETTHLNEEQPAVGEMSDLNKVKGQAYNDLLPHFNHMWERLTSEERQELLKEALHISDTSWQAPFREFSGSELFHDFVLEKAGTPFFQLNVEELEKALERLADPLVLGASNLKSLKSVARRLQSKGQPVSVLETGRAISQILKEAWERLHGSDERSDYAAEWRFYNILYYRYFRKQPLKNAHIAARIGFSPRQYYRERNKAIEALLNVLLEMETLAKMNAGA